MRKLIIIMVVIAVVQLGFNLASSVKDVSDVRANQIDAILDQVE